MPYIGGLDILAQELRQEVEQHLASNEQVLMCANPEPRRTIGIFGIPPAEYPSMHVWVATNRRLLIIHGRQGFLEKKHSFRSLSINYNEITGVELEGTNGIYLWVTTATLHTWQYITNYETAPEDPAMIEPIDNLLILDDKARPYIQQFITVITDPIRKISNPPNIAPNTSNLTAELMNLARLFRDGYLTQAEFDAAKKKLGL